MGGFGWLWVVVGVVSGFGWLWVVVGGCGGCGGAGGCGWMRVEAGGLTPTQQSLLFNMVHGLLPNYERLLKFGLGQSDQCNFCCQKDDLYHFLQCPQAAEMGVLTRSILQEINTDQKELPWLHIRVFNLNLSPIHRLPAMILIAELGLRCLQHSVESGAKIWSQQC